MNKNRITGRSQSVRLRVLFILVCLMLSFCSLPAVAAQRPVKITECKLLSAKKLRVTATLNDTSKITGKKLYLFNISFAGGGIGSGQKPVKAVKKGRTMRFTVNKNAGAIKSMLYDRFVIAQKNANGRYTIVSQAKYITNPGKAAKYKYSFPKAASKKGLQVSAHMVEDAAELNVQHSVLNIVFTELIASSGMSNSKYSIPYKFQGKTYWFLRPVVETYDRQLKALKENNTIVSAILLLGWRSDLTNLIIPDGRQKGHSFYQWNTASQSARLTLQAAISFLAERYSANNGSNGRIVNWIVGNEVNDYKTWNYGGYKSLTAYMQDYARSFRLTYSTVKSVYSNARVYISLNHLWNTSVAGCFTARSTLETFARILGSGGGIRWHLAYHPYSSPLTEPRFWKNANQQLQASLTSPVINMGNISLLNNYIRNRYGKSTRIILSEQGYTSVQNGHNVSAAQAAAIVYSYYLTEASSQIDSFIMNRHVDHQVEIDQGLNLGLWTTSDVEWAYSKKEAWDVFKYMDTNLSRKYADAYLSVIGAPSWSSLVKGFNSGTYQKKTVKTGTLNAVSGYRLRQSLASGWKAYGAAAGINRQKNAVRVLRDPTRNKNCLWGFTQSFKNTNFKKYPVFFSTMNITGATSGSAIVKIRMFSGSKRIFESIAVVPCGSDVPMATSLSSWKYRNKVTRIQVLLAPNGGTWSGTSSFTLKNIGRGS